MIVAHENVRKRLNTDELMALAESSVSPSGLPVITFHESVTFHWNGDEIVVFHVANAHTDGDSIVHFRKANVIHAGDTYFNGFYPYIDVGSGGSIDGVIAASDAILEIADDKTKIIPGHGGLSGVEQLRAYRHMLIDARNAIASLIHQGLSRDAVIEAKPTAALDDQWGGGFMKPDQWVGLVFDGMTRDSE
ncbi:MAG: hypothetical protein O3A46_14470 [Candidatus Poribacteria bacterium]|nr:hypothetical protein [Candidatus Poribacteria bacterium]